MKLKHTNKTVPLFFGGGGGTRYIVRKRRQLAHRLPIVSERELKFTFAIGYRPSVCLSVVCP